MTFPLHLKHTYACPLPVGWATSFLLPSTALECTQRHRLRVRAQVCMICMICVICKPPRPLQEGRECPASPIPCQEHLRQGCRCACPEPQGRLASGGENREGVLGGVVPPARGLFSFPPKNPERSFCGAAQPAAEVLRGWCGEGGVEKGGRRDQSRSYWEMASNSCCVYLRRQMDVEPGFLEDP